MIGKRCFLALTCGLLVCQWLPAGNEQLDTEVVSDTEQVSDTQMDSIAKLYETKLQELVTRRETMDADNNTLLNPRYYRLFGRATLYSSSVSDALETEEKIALFEAPSAPDYLPLSQDSRLARNESLEKAIDQAVLNASITNPEQFVLTEGRIKEQVKTVSDVTDQQVVVQMVPGIVRHETSDNQIVGMQLKVKKPNFWKTSGEASLQFTQNYVSGNWSQGGENTQTLVSWLILKANYDDKQKLQWDNAFEAKLGFTTTPSDTKHNYRTNTDMLRGTSKLGIKAIKSWYYSADVMVKTQILRNYQANSDKFNSAFLSPLEVTVGLGMDYKKNFKNVNLSVNVAPLSYRYLYVSDRKMVAHRYGIEEGHRSLQEFGSKIVVNSSWKLYKNITWTSHIDAFTSYEKVYANWENTFDFAVSKYLSTKLFLHGRFDDGVARKKGYSYFQFKEYLQFGLSYKW